MGDVYAYRFAYRDPGVGKDMAKDAVAGVKQLLVDDWNATCAFRRGIVMVAINVGSMVGQAQVPGGGLAARGAIVAAQTAAQQWISTTWKCQ
jgi:hypothetical protein